MIMVMMMVMVTMSGVDHEDDANDDGVMGLIKEGCSPFFGRRWTVG